MRIRFFNTYEPVTTLYRDLTPFLVSAGHQVDVVMSKAVYRSGRDLDEALGYLKGVLVFKTINLGMHPNRKITKALVMVLYIIHAALYSLLGPKVDCNVFLTHPPLFPLWGYILSRIRHQPYYCVVMDIYPQQLVEHGLMRRDALLTKVLSWLSGLALRRANGVVVIGRCMMDRVRAIGVQPERVHLILNWIDERIVYPVDREHNRLRKKWGLEGKFVVLYVGNMGLSHYFGDILEVAEQLNNQENITFVFIGSGSRYQEVKAQVENRQLTNVSLLPFQGISLWAQSFSVGDLHLVVLREECTGLIVPSKAYGILAAGRPMIYQGSQDGEIARMILEQGIGAVVPCGDAEGLKQSILRYVNQPDLCKIQGRKARELVKGPYGRTRAIEQYAALLTGQRGDSTSQEVP